MKISVIIATRGRPDSLSSTIKSILITATTPDVEIVVYVDDDDIPTIECCKSFNNSSLKVITGPRPHIIAEAYNIAYEHCTGEIIMVCCDDIRFETVGWNQLVSNEFNKIDDRIAIVYGDDGFKHEKKATLPFMHQNWIEVVGYVLPPYFVRENGDRWLTDVSRLIGRCIYLPEMHIRHELSTQRDKTDIERREMSKINPPPEGRWEFYKQLAPKREEDANKLRDFISILKEH